MPIDNREPTRTSPAELGSPTGALLGSFVLSSLGGLLLVAGFNFFLSPAFLIPAAALVFRFAVNVPSKVRGVARVALALAGTGLLVYAVLIGSVVAESWRVGLKLLGGSLLFLLAPLLIWELWKK